MATETPTSDHNRRSSKLDAFCLAAGLLKADRRLLPSLLFLLSLPTLSEFLIAPSALLVAFDRVLQLSVLSFVVLRWRRRFESPLSARLHPAPVVIRIFLIGSILWIALTTSLSVGLASSAGSVGPSVPLTVLGILGFILSLIWCVRLFFYYVVAGMLGTSWRSVLARSRRLYRRNPMAVFYCCVSPFALSTLIFALCYLPYPDGRLVVLTAIASIGKSIFWLLSTYTGIGWAFSLFESSDWKAANLAPYTISRLQTFETQGKGYLADILRPKVGYQIAIISLMIFGLVVFRLSTQPPSVHMSITAVSVDDSILRVTLTIEDLRYRFHGFKPALFSLRSKGGYPVDARLIEASLRQGSHEVTPAIVSSRGPSKALFLGFQTSLTNEHLSSLEDLWLWYGLQPIQAISKEMLSVKDQDVQRSQISLRFN